jgi:hypothetical protein
VIERLALVHIAFNWTPSEVDLLTFDDARYFAGLAEEKLKHRAM